MSEDGTAIVEPTSRSAMDDREALERDVSDKDGIDAGDQRVEDVSETVDKHNQPEVSYTIYTLASYLWPRKHNLYSPLFATT